MTPSYVIPHPTDLLTPRQHGQLLISPDPATLCHHLNGITPQNRMVIRWPGIPENIATLARQDVAIALQTAGQAGPDPQVPWILTGHQVEFYHAGVWAKVILSSELARKCSGVAIDLLVDHDIVREMGFFAPIPQAEHWHRDEVIFAPATALTADSLPAPAGAALAAWLQHWQQQPLAAQDTYQLLAREFQRNTPGPYVPWLVGARARLEQQLDIPIYRLPTSTLCSGRAFLTFVAAWMRQATTWVPLYNRCLAQYRVANQIHSPSHPLPDLAYSSTEIELPFWIYQPGQPRLRLHVQNQSGQIHLLDTPIMVSADLPPSALAEQLATQLQQHGFVLRPRALTLTMFVRGFLSDVFIHGLGGALYDQITDAFFLALTDTIPAYACASACWLLPIAHDAPAPTAPSALRHAYHHQWHNPQPSATDATVMERQTQIKTLVTQIDHSKTTQWHAEKAQRLAWYRELLQIKATLRAQDAAALTRLEQGEQIAQAQMLARTVTHSREYYIGLHSLASLTALRQQIRATVQS
jgi:hypothetical protein